MRAGLASESRCDSPGDRVSDVLGCNNPRRKRAEYVLLYLPFSGRKGGEGWHDGWQIAGGPGWEQMVPLAVAARRGGRCETTDLLLFLRAHPREARRHAGANAAKDEKCAAAHAAKAGQHKPATKKTTGALTRVPCQRCRSPPARPPPQSRMSMGFLSCSAASEDDAGDRRNEAHNTSRPSGDRGSPRRPAEWPSSQTASG